MESLPYVLGAVVRDRTGDLILRLHPFFIYTRGLDCIFLRKFRRPLSVVRARIFSPRSWPRMAINRYSGFAFALLREWAGTAFHHECALPTELQRHILNCRQKLP